MANDGFAIISNRTIKDWYHTLSKENKQKLRNTYGINGKPLALPIKGALTKDLRGLEKVTGISEYHNGDYYRYVSPRDTVIHNAKTAVEQQGYPKSHVGRRLGLYLNSPEYKNNVGKIIVKSSDPDNLVFKIHEQLEALEVKKNPKPKINFLNKLLPNAKSLMKEDLLERGDENYWIRRNQFENGHHTPKVPVIEYMLQNRAGGFDPKIRDYRKSTGEYPAIIKALKEVKKTDNLRTVRLRKADYMKAAKKLLKGSL